MSHALQLLNQYHSDDDDDVQSISSDDKDVKFDEDPILESARQTLLEVVNKVVRLDRGQEHRNHFIDFRSTNNQDEIDLSSESSDSDDHGSVEDIIDEDCDGNNLLPPRTPGELGLEDLPPIEQLSIRAQVEDLCHLGRIATIIDCLISVQSFKGQAALDLDSVLFLKDGSPLGLIFEVFGPVKEPRYLIRFNSREEIEERGLKVDLPVYCAPILGAPITSYVFTTDLMKMKGSDASWKHNNEPPEELREFSDDEQEKIFKLKSKSKRKSSTPTGRRTQFASPSSLRAPPNTPANFDPSMNSRRLGYP